MLVLTYVERLYWMLRDRAGELHIIHLPNRAKSVGGSKAQNDRAYPMEVGDLN
jgi:hypothetical protein